MRKFSTTWVIWIGCWERLGACSQGTQHMQTAPLEVAVAAMAVAKRLGAGVTESIITVEQRRKKGPQRGVAGP